VEGRTLIVTPQSQFRWFGRKFGLVPLAWRDYVEENKEEKGPHASL